jgi:glutamine synthetase type III
LPEEYIRQELEWVLELFKDLEFYEENELLKVYEKLLKSYLTLIVSIKELKIPYMQYHPIVPLAVDVKSKIAKLMKKLTVRQDEV